MSDKENKTEQPVDFAKLIQEQVQAQLKMIVPQVVSQLKASLSPVKEESVSEGPSLSDKASKDPDISALKAELTKMKNQMKAEKASLLNEKAANQLKSMLTGKVVAGSEDVVTNYLMKAKGAIQVGEDGIKFMNGVMDMDLAEGVSEWLKSDEAKHFVPAPQAKNFKAPPVKQNPTGAAVDQLIKEDFSKLSETEQVQRAAELLQSQGLI